MSTHLTSSGFRCYHCGSTNATKAGTFKERQRLRCHDCGRRFYSGPVPVRIGSEPVSSGVRCYHCGSTETRKAGFSRFGNREKQKYHCRSCNRYFRENLEVPAAGEGKKRNFWVRKNLPSAGHLILELRAVTQSLGRTPTVYDINERSKQGLGNSVNTYRAVFGTFREAIARARLTPDSPRVYPPEKMIAELRELKRKLGRPVRLSDIRTAYRKGKVPSFYFLKRAFGSVAKALRAAGVGRKTYTRAEMIECLRKLDASLDRRINRADILRAYRKGEGPSVDALRDMFGTTSKARKLAGLKKHPVYSPGTRKAPPLKYSNEQLIADLKRLGEKLGRRPTGADIQQAQKQGLCADISTYKNRFGGFREACRKAGFPEPVIGKKKDAPRQSTVRRYTKNELIAYMATLIKELGRFPGDEDLREASKAGRGPTANTITKHLGKLSEIHNRYFPDSEALRFPSRYTDEEVKISFLRFVEELGRFPTYADLLKGSKTGKCPSPETVAKRLGRLSDLKKSFGPDSRSVTPGRPRP